jgi:ribosomal protein L12E/L44/L45/RPP1/RPP2
VKDEDIDIQFVKPDYMENLSPNEVRVNILKQLDKLQNEIKKSKGLIYYTDSSAIFGNTRQGKITLIAGLNGISSFKDDYSWLRIFAKQGIHYLFLNAKDFSFKENGLSEESKNLIKTANEARVLLIVSGLNDEQIKEVLKTSKSPMIVVSKKLPSEECLNLIKEGEHALALKFSKEETSSDYFKKLKEAKEKLGSKDVLIWNEECLWSKEGRGKYFDLITCFVMEKWEREDLSSIFSGTFLRVLGKARKEGPRRPFVYIPF